MKHTNDATARTPISERLNLRMVSLLLINNVDRFAGAHEQIHPQFGLPVVRRWSCILAWEDLVLSDTTANVRLFRLVLGCDYLSNVWKGSKPVCSQGDQNMYRRLLTSLGLLVVLSAAALAQQPAPPKTHLKVGDKAPEFSLRATDGKTYKLSDFKGQKNVVLAIYVLAFTGG